MFQCHLVRFKLFRRRVRGLRNYDTTVSMPSGSIQAIPLAGLRAEVTAQGVSMPSGSIQAIPHYVCNHCNDNSGFQCHLVRFKLFRTNYADRVCAALAFQCHLVRFKLFRRRANATRSESC